MGKVSSKFEKNKKQAKNWNNIIIKNNISIKELSDEEKKIISKVPKTNQTYICSRCKEIPLISLSLVSGKISLTIDCKDGRRYSNIDDLYEFMNFKFKLVNVKK